jgi:hypothetical protein
MLEHFVAFYKKLFGKEPRSNIRLGEGFWEENEKVFVEDNEMLEAELSEEEILRAIKGSYVEGAPRPDGFSFLFYQKNGLPLKVTWWLLWKGLRRGRSTWQD